MYTQAFIVAVFSVAIKLDAALSVPPEACFANFRWEDCGGSPVKVLYYWKPGSRCEVGIWRGCLPNMNMFKDEYECVSTCIFSARAQPPDYHALIHEDILDGSTVSEHTTEIQSTTTEAATTNTEVVSHTAADNGNSTSGGANSTST